MQGTDTGRMNNTDSTSTIQHSTRIGRDDHITQIYRQGTGTREDWVKGSGIIFRQLVDHDLIQIINY